MERKYNCNQSDYAVERRNIIEGYYLSVKRIQTPHQFIDCYGFIHDTLEEAQHSRMLSCKSNTQANLNLLLNSKTDLDKRKRSNLIKQLKCGIPQGVRPVAWKAILNIDYIKRNKRGIYKKVLIQSLRFSPHVRQIHLDVQRTFRKHISFSEEHGLKQIQLFNVLLAYSAYNAEVGYCQGMSEVVALLLMFMGEEDCFWATERLFSDPLYNLHGIFTLNFPRLFSLQEHHDYLLKRYSRSLYIHLIRKHEITSPLYTFRWFMQCFMSRIPFSTTLRVYDMFLVEGDGILSVMSFVIMRVLRKEIKSCNFEGIMKLLNRFPLFSEDISDKIFKKCKKYRKIFENDGCYCAPKKNQTLPMEPLILSDPVRYAKECARLHPREATYEDIIADGVKNIESRRQNDTIDLDEGESCATDVSPVSLESCFSRSSEFMTRRDTVLKKLTTNTSTESQEDLSFSKPNLNQSFL